MTHALVGVVRNLTHDVQSSCGVRTKHDCVSQKLVYILFYIEHVCVNIQKNRYLISQVHS